jgi:hypothetical protein
MHHIEPGIVSVHRLLVCYELYHGNPRSFKKSFTANTFVDTGVYSWQGFGPRYNEDYLELAQVDYEEDAVKPGAQTDAQG